MAAAVISLQPVVAQSEGRPVFSDFIFSPREAGTHIFM